MNERNQKLYVFPSGNKYDSELIIQAIAKSDSSIILDEDKEFFQAVHNAYWQSQSNS